jgi:kinetochore protein Spc7/SPC105
MTSTTNQPPSQAPEALATPEAEQDPDAAFSPIQPGLHGQEISGDLSSSPFSGSSVGGSEGTQSPVKEGIDEEAESDTDNDFDGEGTAMSLDEVTARTTATTQSDSSSTSSSSRLNEALRQAAHEAGTRGIDFDENGDMSMEMADQEITGAFKPWITKGQRISFDTEDMSALQDEENINHFQGQAQSENHDENDDDDDGNDYYNENEELSMEITNAVGRIFGSNPNRLSIGRRKSTAEETTYGDRTMEFTNVVGGIADHQSPAKSDIGSVVSENEEMTMEFTSVVGGVLGKGISGSERSDGNVLPDSVQESNLVGRDFSEWSTDGDGADEMDMEFTGAIGGILSPIEEQTESQDEFTGGMDVTAVMGTILPPGLETNNKQQAKQLMELESDAGQLVSSPFQERVNLSPPKLSASHHIAPVASESGSPSLASVRSRQTGRSSSTGTGTPLRQTTPRKPMTPSKQLTPQPLRPSNPGKTPPSSNVTFRSASPKKLFKHEIRAAAKQSHSPHLFENDEQTGESTPAIILRPPHSRRSSGLGIDKEGLGSPKVAALLDRRRSIGEDAQEFVPQDEPSRRLRFDDPVKIHEEVDREREEEENREDGHIPPVNDLDATSNLKELISSLTPKKRKVGTRKSLHVGAAKGVLGKRPVELDEEEEEESPKRLRGRNASPVKSIKLPAPPSKDETVGRAARPSTNKLFDLSPQKTGSFTPRKPNPTIAVTSPSKNAQTSEDVPETAEQEAEDGEDVDLEPIQLQDFLNMTNIHFMELTTTKRRHTTAPGNDSNALERTGTRDANREISLEDCVAAGFCTVPMLELYQHVSSSPLSTT